MQKRLVRAAGLYLGWRGPVCGFGTRRRRAAVLLRALPLPFRPVVLALLPPRVRQAATSELELAGRRARHLKRGGGCRRGGREMDVFIHAADCPTVWRTLRRPPTWTLSPIRRRALVPAPIMSDDEIDPAEAEEEAARRANRARLASALPRAAAVAAKHDDDDDDVEFVNQKRELQGARARFPPWQSSVQLPPPSPALLPHAAAGRKRQREQRHPAARPRGGAQRDLEVPSDDDDEVAVVPPPTRDVAFDEELKLLAMPAEAYAGNAVKVSEALGDGSDGDAGALATISGVDVGSIKSGPLCRAGAAARATGRQGPRRRRCSRCPRPRARRGDCGRGRAARKPHLRVRAPGDASVLPTTPLPPHSPRSRLKDGLHADRAHRDNVRQAVSDTIAADNKGWEGFSSSAVTARMAHTPTRAALQSLRRLR